MPFALEQMTQGLSINSVTNYQAVNNTSLNTAVVDMQKFQRVMFLGAVPSLGAAGTLDGRLQSNAKSDFSGTVNNIASTNLTQITTSTTPGNNAVFTLEVRADQLTAGDRYVRLQLTGGGNSINVGPIIGLGGEAEFKPASQNDVSNTYLSQRIVK
jgi:hypothetical protein